MAVEERNQGLKVCLESVVPSDLQVHKAHPDLLGPQVHLDSPEPMEPGALPDRLEILDVMENLVVMANLVLKDRPEKSGPSVPWVL